MTILGFHVTLVFLRPICTLSMWWLTGPGEIDDLLLAEIQDQLAHEVEITSVS